MSFTFRKAKRSASYLRVLVCGPSGAGKTYSAIQLAKGIGGRIAVIDTEAGSADLYAHLADYDVCRLDPPHMPDRYIQAMQAAVDAGYDVIIIDSLSHAWKALLEFKERLDSGGGNNFQNWAKAKPHWQALIKAILGMRAHVIACARSRTEWVIETKGSAPKKVGMGSILEGESEYEFTVVFDIDREHHRAMASKDRTELFDSMNEKITPATGAKLAQWIDGAPPEPAEIAATAPELPARAKPPTATQEAKDWLLGMGLDEEQAVTVVEECKSAGVKWARACLRLRDMGLRLTEGRRTIEKIGYKAGDLPLHQIVIEAEQVGLTTIEELREHFLQA